MAQRFQLFRFLNSFLENPTVIIFAVLLGFFLRVWNVGTLDILGDEAAYAFRSIGYLDYLGTNFQTQPVDWYKDEPLPWWTRLSFHDHPPLGFLIQHLFFRIFGDSIFAARLSGAVFGTASIWVLYLLVQRLTGDKRLALAGAFIFAISGAMVWIARTSLLEPILLFFILLNIYFFFRFLEDRRYWWIFGITFGLALLTKYTGVFLLPVYLTIGLIGPIRPISLIGNWRFYGAFLVALVLFSPVIVYNVFLFKERGHFDLQFAYLLRQETPEWSGLVGKTQFPFADIAGNMLTTYGWVFLTASFIGLTYAVYKTYRTYKSDKTYMFICLYSVFLTLLLLKIGSANRFLVLYGPAFVVLIVLGLRLAVDFKAGWTRVFFMTATVAFLSLELFYAFDKNWLKKPDYGVAKLDLYLDREFRGSASAVVPEADNRHLNDVIYRFVKNKPDAARKRMLIIYNDNIALPTLEWVFYRRFFYQSIPTMFVENFERVAQREGEGYFKGFEIYFVESTEHTLLNPFKRDKEAGRRFEENLEKQGLAPAYVVYGQADQPMFKIYKFSI